MGFLLDRWQPKSFEYQSSGLGIGNATIARSVDGSILVVGLVSSIACSRKGSGLFADCCLEQPVAVVRLATVKPTAVELAIVKQ